MSYANLEKALLEISKELAGIKELLSLNINQNKSTLDQGMQQGNLFYSVHEVTAKLGVSAPTLQRIRKNDQSFPKPYRFSGEKTLRYKIDEIDQWIENHRSEE